MTKGNFEPQLKTLTADIATPADIYEQLRAIAFVNEDFREGISGTFTLSVEQGEPVLSPDFKSVDSNWPNPYVSESYDFEAKRVETDEDSIELGFTYGYTSVAHNIRLPLYIAAYSFGAEEDPVAAAGPSRMVRSLYAEISSNDYDLGVIETVKYYDKDDDLVMEVDSDAHPQDTTGQTVIPHMPKEVFPDNDDDEEDEDVDDAINHASLIDQSVPVYFRNNAVDLHERYEGAPDLDDLDAFADDYDRDGRDLVVAYHVLQSLKKAFRRQLGMPI